VTSLTGVGGLNRDLFIAVLLDDAIAFVFNIVNIIIHHGSRSEQSQIWTDRQTYIHAGTESIMSH